MADITYTAKYRLVNRIFWTTVKKVVGDGFMTDQPLRFFETEDGSMIYFPSNAEVHFAKERKLAIIKKMSAEAGQSVQVR